MLYYTFNPETYIKLFAEFFCAILYEVVIQAVTQRKEEKERRRRALLAAAKAPASLNAAPSPDDLFRQWRRSRMTLLDTLKLGSMLRDLEPVVDNSFIRITDAKGESVIVGREPGIKGWLAENGLQIRYKTAMGYKVLADRMRRACGLPKDVPLEWIFPDQAGFDGERSQRTKANLPVARAKLGKLLSGCRFISELLGRLDAALNIVHKKLRFKRKSPIDNPRVENLKKSQTVARNLRSRLMEIKTRWGAAARSSLKEELLAFAELL